MLIEKEANTRAKPVHIQASLTPHMEILQKELAYAEIELKKDPNLSTLDSYPNQILRCCNRQLGCYSKDCNGSQQDFSGQIHNQCIDPLT